MSLLFPRILIVASLSVLVAACGSSGADDIQARLDRLEQRIDELERDDQVARSFQDSGNRTAEIDPEDGSEVDGADPGSQQSLPANSETVVDLADAVFLAFADSAVLEGPSDGGAGVDVRGSGDEVTIALAEPSEEQRSVIESLLGSLGFAEEVASSVARGDAASGSVTAGDLQASWQDGDGEVVLVITRVG